MADRYWVGGSATWDGTAGTKWATTSGGAGGASVPTSSDDVYINGASGAVTVTLGGGTIVARSVDFTGFTGTFSIPGGNTLWVYGPVFKLVSGMTYSHSGVVLIAGANGVTTAVTTAGKTLGAFQIGSGSPTPIISLQDSFTSNSQITLTVGTFQTNNFSVTASSFSSTSGSTRVLTLGSSSLTFSNSFNVTGSNVTITSNTATVNLTYGGIINQNLNGWNWNGLKFTANNPSYLNILTGGTIGALTMAPTSPYTELRLTQDLTITGALTLTGYSSGGRLLVYSKDEGVTRTLSAGSVSASNVIFRDINATGAANWNLSNITGGSGNGGRNTGITFTGPQANYYRSGVSNFYDSASWSLTSGGTATGRFPLPQDIAILDGNSASAITWDDNIQMGSFNAADYTGTISIDGISLDFYGDFIVGSGVSFTEIGSTPYLNLFGFGTHTLSSAISMSPNFNIYGGGTYNLATNWVGSRGFEIYYGTFKMNGYDLTIPWGFYSNTASCVLYAEGSTFAAGSVNFYDASTAYVEGTDFITTSTGTIFWADSDVTLVGRPNITINTASASSRTITGGSHKFGTITYTLGSSTGQLTIDGNNTIRNINFSGSVRNLVFIAGTTNTIDGTFNVFGTAGNLVTVKSSSSGTAATLTKNGGGVTDDLNYASIQDINATPNATPRWYATNSTNVSGNTGITFSASPYTSTSPVELSIPYPGSVPFVDTGHEVLVRARVSSGAGTVNVELRQGSILIESWMHDINSTFTDYTYMIPSASAAYITDYFDLSLHIWGNATSGQTLDISQAYLTTPHGGAMAGSIVVTSAANDATIQDRQIIRPNGDITITGWTTNLGGTTNLYATLDEVGVDDSDYVTAVMT